MSRECKAFPSASAASATGPVLFVGSSKISIPGIAVIGMAAGGTPTEGYPGNCGRYIQSAFCKAACSNSQKAGPSSAAGEMAALYRCPAKACASSAMNCCLSANSVRGRFSFSNSTSASRVFRAASAPRACASAICARAVAESFCSSAIRSSDDCLYAANSRSFRSDIIALGLFWAYPDKTAITLAIAAVPAARKYMDVDRESHLSDGILAPSEIFFLASVVISGLTFAAVCFGAVFVNLRKAMSEAVPSRTIGTRRSRAERSALPRGAT